MANKGIDLTTEAVANALLKAKIDKVVGGFLERNEGPYQDQIQSLSAQLDDPDLLSDVREHIKGAVAALHEAENRANEPRLRKVALAVISVLNEYRIPLQLKNGQGNSEPKVKQGRQSAAEQERRLMELALRNGDDGFTTTEAAQVLDVSIATGRKACLRLVAQNKIRHNGRPKQRSRYLLV